MQNYISINSCCLRGIKEVKKNISEEEELNPVLSYATSKANNEKQIKGSGKKFVILRLGSVYGYSTDTARIDIMPNLFSKISITKWIIKTFCRWKTIKKPSSFDRCSKVF
jgi:dTDP-4-dehydrorhamnose reductase